MLQEPPEIPASIVLQKTGSSTLRSKTLFCCYLSVNKRLSLVQCEQVPVACSYGFSEQSLCHHGIRDSLEACDVGACATLSKPAMLAPATRLYPSPLRSAACTLFS